MSIDKVLQATLLLTVFFNKREAGKVKPLTPLEYGRFAAWLHQQGLSPADLLNGAGEVLASWVDPKKKITAERINELLARGASMGFALENWHKQGVWILSRGSTDYPRAIRKHLGDARPPVLFGVGNKSLLNKPGIGFVGSRSIDDSDAQFTRKLACLAVEQGYIVISGGAKGIDQTAMAAALDHGGESVGVLADSLLKSSTMRIYREAIQDERLILISPYYPEAGWSQGNAMGRNKYIYTLSQAVVAVKSDYEKGGTWAGAVENQKKGWVPLMVRDANHKGNQALIKQGAIAVSENFDDFQSILDVATSPLREEPVKSAADMAVEGGLFSGSHNAVTSVESEAPNTESVDVQNTMDGASLESPSPVDSSINEDKLEDTESSPRKATDPVGTDSERLKSLLKGTPLETYGEVFGVFLKVLTEVAHAERSVTPATLQEKFPELPANLIKKWLAELEQQNLLVREGKKLSYTLPAPDLFE